MVLKIGRDGVVRVERESSNLSKPVKLARRDCSRTKPTCYRALPSEGGGPLPHKDSDQVYSADEVEFFMAIDAYKEHNRRPFPTWCEVLAVLLKLGYRKTDVEER